MANFQRIKTLSKTCTRQDIYDLIGQAGLVNLTSQQISDFAAPNVTAASGPPTFAANNLWWDQTTQLLKVPCDMVGSTAASLWLAVGPDAWHFPGFNVCAYTLPRGTLVRFALGEGAPSWGMTPMEPVSTQATTPRMCRIVPTWRNLFGVTQEPTPPYTFGPVLTFGIGRVNLEMRAGEATVLNGPKMIGPSSQHTGLSTILGTSWEQTSGYMPSVYMFGTLLCGLGASSVTSVMWTPAWIQFPIGQRGSATGDYLK